MDIYKYNHYIFLIGVLVCVVYTWASWIFLENLWVFDLSWPRCPGPIFIWFHMYPSISNILNHSHNWQLSHHLPGRGWQLLQLLQSGDVGGAKGCRGVLSRRQKSRRYGNKKKNILILLDLFIASPMNHSGFGLESQTFSFFTQP